MWHWKGKGRGGTVTATKEASIADCTTAHWMLLLRPGTLVAVQCHRNRIASHPLLHMVCTGKVGEGGALHARGEDENNPN